MNSLHPIKIDGFVLPHDQRRKELTTAAEGASASASDQVVLSSESHKLNAGSKDYAMVVERMKVLPEVRSSLLTQARKRVATAFYHNPEVIRELADKVIDTTA